MSLLSRVAKLEAAVGQLTTDGAPDTDSLGHLAALLDDYPSAWLENVGADRVVEVRSICKSVASRARDGEFRTCLEFMRELPTEALRGIASQRKHAG